MSRLTRRAHPVIGGNVVFEHDRYAMKWSSLVSIALQHPTANNLPSYLAFLTFGVQHGRKLVCVRVYLGNGMEGAVHLIDAF